MTAPCKDCERRTVGCHSSCPEYQEFRLERDRINHEACLRNDTRIPLSRWMRRCIKRNERRR